MYINASELVLGPDGKIPMRHIVVKVRKTALSPTSHAQALRKELCSQAATNALRCTTYGHAAAVVLDSQG
jgi:hypothetical protein